LPLRNVYSFANRVLVLGSALSKFSRTAIPSETLVWASIGSGPGKGLSIQINPRYEMEYLEGNYEVLVEQVLLSNLRPGTVFYDVGAHIGVFSLIAARSLGVQGSVFAFEPDPSNVRRIKEHIARNGLNAIQVIPKAASSTDGRLPFQRASFQSSMNRGVLVEDASIAEGATIQVDSITLDAVARAHTLPSMIKIDVEGSEAAVLQGSEEIFRSARPSLSAKFITSKLPPTLRAGCWLGAISSNGSRIRRNFLVIFSQGMRNADWQKVLARRRSIAIQILTSGLQPDI
jgi:FkbM family methyltransferase